MHPGDHRVCFVGDSFIHGSGDAAGLSWPGRVAATARAAGWDLTAYNLGVRRDTSVDIAVRWEAECEARFHVECTPYIVFSFGANDMTILDDALRVPIPESVDNFRNIIGTAKHHCRTLFVGPLPVNDAAQDVRIISLCAIYAQLAAEANIPYLSLAEDLSGDAAWQHAVAAGDGTHPGAEGYALVAERVSNWSAWWFNANQK